MDMDFAMFQQLVANVEDDNNVAARFYDKAVKSGNVNENGLPVFKNVTYVEIRLKDNNTEVYNQPATNEKIRRFPREYALYQLAKEKVKSGTPLEQFAFLTAAEIETCKSRGLFTVEDLAALDERKVQTLGLQNENILAKKFVQNAQNNNFVAQMAVKEKEYQRKIAELEDKIRDLQRALNNNHRIWSFGKGEKK